MKTHLKNIAKVRIGYQLRERLDNEPSGTYRLLQMRDITGDDTIQTSELTWFTPERDASRYVVARGDVLFLARGNRNVAQMTDGLNDNVVASNHFLIATPDSSKIRPGYLSWYLNSRSVQSFLRSHTQGTTLKLLRRSVFENIELEVPPLEIQERVIELAALREKERRLLEEERRLHGMLERKRDALVEAACLGMIENAIPRSQ